MIVGTAGHIDHGKTSLVRALTGVDTDRLEEEKARGISIELGYAYVPIESRPIDGGPVESGPPEGGAQGGDPVLGFVDVPGHERLVHTMVAGAGGIDFALLVVAADDGVMPQTREHLAILDLLGVARGAVAITKADRVEPARVRAVEAEIRALLAPGFLRDAPLFPLVATSPGDAGVAALRAHLHAVAARSALRAADGLFRLAVDRVFSLAGHGTIATGTVHAGCVRVGDSVTILPQGIAARVRGIHAQNREADVGLAGQRCAINLAGIERAALARGDWLADARALRASRRVDVRLRLLPGAAAVRAGTPLHVHAGTAHRVARAVPLEGERAAAGDGALLQFVFDEPVCLAAGDRFILRDAQAAHTIGGGVVLDPAAPERRRRSPARLAWLDAIERLQAGEGTRALLDRSPRGLALDELVRLCGREPARIELPGDVRRFATPAGTFLLSAANEHALRARMRALLDEYHAAQPDEAGIELARLRRMVDPAFDAGLWRAFVDAAIADGELGRSGAWLHRPQHRVELNAAEQALLERLLPRVRQGGFDPPWVRDHAAALGVDEALVRAALRKSAARGDVLQVVRDLFYAHERIDELVALLRDLAASHGSVDAARWRDALGLGRKRAIQILECFDRVGYTRRVRDTRILRGDGIAASRD